MKEEKGITIVSLTITIIVLLILTTFTVITAGASYQQHKDSQAIAELGIVQHAVMEQYYTYTVTKNEADLKGKKLTLIEAQEVATKMKETLIESDRIL